LDQRPAVVGPRHPEVQLLPLRLADIGYEHRAGARLETEPPGIPEPERPDTRIGAPAEERIPGRGSSVAIDAKDLAAQIEGVLRRRRIPKVIPGAYVEGPVRVEAQAAGVVQGGNEVVSQHDRLHAESVAHYREPRHAHFAARVAVVDPDMMVRRELSVEGNSDATPLGVGPTRDRLGADNPAWPDNPHVAPLSNDPQVPIGRPLG